MFFRFVTKTEFSSSGRNVAYGVCDRSYQNTLCVRTQKERANLFFGYVSVKYKPISIKIDTHVLE